MEQIQKAKMICLTCGSDAISTRATVRWNPEHQDWDDVDSVNVDDEIFCDNCDCETEVALNIAEHPTSAENAWYNVHRIAGESNHRRLATLPANLRKLITDTCRISGALIGIDGVDDLLTHGVIDMQRMPAFPERRVASGGRAA